MSANGVTQFTYQGKTMGYKAWAKESGISEVTLRRRVSAGMTIGEAIEKGTERKSWAEQITCNGVTKTYKEWAEHVGISEKTLRRRLSTKGKAPGARIWTIEEALSTESKHQNDNCDARSKLRETIRNNNKDATETELTQMLDSLLGNNEEDNDVAFKQQLDEAFRK